MVSSVTLKTMVGPVTPAPSLSPGILSETDPEYFGVIVCLSVGEVLTQRCICVQIRNSSKYGILACTKVLRRPNRHVLVVSNITVITNSNPVPARTSGITHVVMVGVVRIWLAHPRIAAGLEARQARTLASVLCGVEHAQLLAIVANWVVRASVGIWDQLRLSV